MSLSCFNSIYCRNINHFVRSMCPPLLCQVSTFSYLDLPFAMFSHQYESKAIKLYYSMSTISYIPWFSYQINMTLIECSRIRKDRPFAWRSDSGPPRQHARLKSRRELPRPAEKYRIRFVLHVHDILYS